MAEVDKILKKSRWEETKSRSKWHFDPSKEPEESDFLHVCRFAGDWDNEVKMCIERSTDFNWTKNQENINKNHKYTGEVQDLVNVNVDPTVVLFSKTRIDDMPVLKNIVDYLKLEKCETRFHNQKTGQIIHWHLDNFTLLSELDETENSEKYSYGKAGQAQRFTVMLDDWKHGQVFAIGNTYFHQWKRGDCITWNWKHMPHATGNMGWEERPLLQITGWITEETIKILKNSSKNRIVKV